MVQTNVTALLPRLLFQLAVIFLVTVILPGPVKSGPQKALSSVVSVLPLWANAQSRTKEPEGSGIVVLDGRKIVTARHVIKNAISIRVKTRDGQILAAQLVAQDPLTDLAVLSIERTLVPMDFGWQAEVGERVCAIGNAFGLGVSMTCGVVSAIHKAGVGFNPIEDFVQTDAAVNPGASGGALVAQDGRLLGVLSAIFTKDSDANIGVNFAVSAALTKRVILALVKDRKINWQYSGLELEPAISRSGTGTLGAVVVNIKDNTPASQAVLKLVML